MSLCACGRDLYPADRFCSQCGLAREASPSTGPSIGSPAPSPSQSPSQSISDQAGESAPGPPSDFGDDESLLLNPAQPVTSIESRSQVSASGFPVRWAAAGIIAAGLLMYALYSWPQAESETAVGGQDLVDGLELDGDEPIPTPTTSSDRDERQPSTAA
ncbi:MAG: hypothetical protein ACR2QK_09635, partial [Acidimicrobiales bacterium]